MPGLDGVQYLVPSTSAEFMAVSVCFGAWPIDESSQPALAGTHSPCTAVPHAASCGVQSFDQKVMHMYMHATATQVPLKLRTMQGAC